MSWVMIRSQRRAAVSNADLYVEDMLPTKTRSISKEGVPGCGRLGGRGAHAHDAAATIRADVSRNPPRRCCPARRNLPTRLCNVTVMDV